MRCKCGIISNIALVWQEARDEESCQGCGRGSATLGGLASRFPAEQTPARETRRMFSMMQEARPAVRRTKKQAGVRTPARGMIRDRRESVDRLAQLRKSFDSAARHVDAAEAVGQLLGFHQQLDTQCTIGTVTSPRPAKGGFDVADLCR